MRGTFSCTGGFSAVPVFHGIISLGLPYRVHVCTPCKVYFIRDVCVPSVRVKDSSPLNPGCVRLPRLASRIVKDCRLPFSERFHGDETVLVLYEIRKNTSFHGDENASPAANENELPQGTPKPVPTEATCIPYRTGTGKTNTQTNLRNRALQALKLFFLCN